MNKKNYTSSIIFCIWDIFLWPSKQLRWRFDCSFCFNSQTHPLVARAEVEWGTVSAAGVMTVSPLVPMEEVDQDLHIVNKHKSCCQINQLPVDIQLCVSHRPLDSFCNVKHCLLLIHDQQQRTTLIRLHCWFYGCRITLLQCMSRLNLPSVCSCLCGKNGKVCNQWQTRL